MRQSKWCVWAILATLIGVATAGPARADDAQTGKQQAKHFETEVTVKVQLNYLLYLPEGYGKEDRKWPLVLFLHGAGESGDNLNLVKKHGPPKLIEAGHAFPCIVVSPQCPRRGWDVQALNALLDDVTSHLQVDPDRVYLTGLSMGGFGTWALAAAHPERFAAIMPICGGGRPEDAAKLKGLAIWVFHGAKDPVVPPRSSEAMVDALKRAGAEQVKFTLYPDADHDSWTATYDDPAVWKWLFEQRRSRAEKP